MNLKQYRDQLVSDLSGVVPAKVKVLAHPGRFDLDELQAYAADAPSLRVSVLKSSDAGVTPEQWNTVDVAIYLITKPLDGQLADEANLVLGGFVRSFVWAGELGGDDAGTPENVVYQNLYNALCKRAGVALGAVSFSQDVKLDGFEAGSATPPQPYLRAFTNYDLDGDGQPEATDHQTLRQE